jgi:hypothetical protein
MQRMGVKSNRTTSSLGVKMGRATHMMGTRHSPQSIMGLFQAKPENHTEGIQNTEGHELKLGREPIRSRPIPVKQFYGLEKKVKSKKYKEEY